MLQNMGPDIGYDLRDRLAHYQALRRMTLDKRTLEDSSSVRLRNF
jgi:hypothetical protein